MPVNPRLFAQLSTLLTLCLGLLLSPWTSAQANMGSETGFNAYIEGLQNAKALIDQAILDDPLIDDGDTVTRAEGYRWAIRMLGGQQRLHLGNEANASHPVISRCPTATCKLGWDNPDYTYISVGPVSHEYTYRLFGKRNTVHIILMQIMNLGGLGGGDTSSSKDLIVDEEGNWEVFVAAQKPEQAKNWLKLDPKSERILIRNIFNDWNAVEASVQVEVLAGPSTKPPVLTPAAFAKKGVVAGKTAPGYIGAFIKIFRAQGLHQFPVPCTGVLTGCSKNNNEIGGFEDILYTVARYHVPEGKALIVEVPAAEAEYRDIQLGNAWTESQDYINRHTSLNSHQDFLDKDGVYRYVLSHQDPGYANWLDISEHSYGSMMMRWIFADMNNPPEAPQAKLVDLSELGKHIPDSHPRVSSDQRAAAMKARRLLVLKRLNPAGL